MFNPLKNALEEQFYENYNKNYKANTNVEKRKQDAFFKHQDDLSKKTFDKFKNLPKDMFETERNFYAFENERVGASEYALVKGRRELQLIKDYYPQQRVPFSHNSTKSFNTTL